MESPCAGVHYGNIHETHLHVWSQLSLSDHLSKFVTGVPNGDRITVRHLPNMTAGVYDYTDEPQFDQDYINNPLLPFSLDDLLTIINRNKPRYPPCGPAQWSTSRRWI
jgi:D-alanyl-D-alanine carboxypeptidase